MTTISVSMIVKNEEACLEKCLKSLVGFDEIVIIDTGSTDGTRDIAKRYTDKYYENEYKWADNFAEARNYALSKCTGDWIFIIDADEWLEESEPEKIRRAIEETAATDTKFISIWVTDEDGKDFHESIRMHKRSKEIHWEAVAHNYLSPLGKTAIYDDIQILAGYSETHKKDPDRTLRILRKAVAANPKLIREVYYLAREYWYRRDYKTALRWYDDYLTRAKWLPEIADAYLTRGRCLWHLQKGEEARKSVLQALNINANFKEALRFMAEMSWPHNAKRWLEFAELADNSNVLFVRGGGKPMGKQAAHADEIHICMATIPSREDILAACVESLLPQLSAKDKLHVCLNGYDHVPGVLSDPRIDVVQSQDVGDLGDAGKFYWLGKVSGYMLTVDDDLLYPSDYVKNLVTAIEEHKRKVVVSYHGILYPNALRDLRQRTVFPCLYSVNTDHGVHALGTGVMGFHTSLLPDLRQDIFKTPNMADIWFALHCQERKVPMRSLKHPGDYFKSLLLPKHESIWGACLTADGSVRDTANLQLNTIQSIHWQVY